MRFHASVMFTLGGACLLSMSSSSHAALVAVDKVHCADADYGYQASFPDGAARPMPAILVLHGAGGHAADALNPWRLLAEKNGIALIAPEIPRLEAFEAVAPKVFRCIVEDAGKRARLDPRRIYVFGHSMGGYLAYDAAMFGSDFYAAATVHAAAIADDYVGIVDVARRKIPVAIYIGDRDRFYSTAQTRKTRDLLLGHGFPVHYVELPAHSHDYYELADAINADAWKFMSAYQLP